MTNQMAQQRGMKVPVKNLHNNTKIETFVDLRRVSEELRNMYFENKISLIYLNEGKIYAKCTKGSITEMKEE